MTSILSAPHFHDEQAAYAFVEARIWANGRVCPKCGTIDQSGALKGKSTRIGDITADMDAEEKRLIVECNPICNKRLG